MKGHMINALALSVVFAGDAAAAPKHCKKADPDLGAWWRGEGDATDSAGTHDATAASGVTYESGKVGQAFRVGTGFVTAPFTHYGAFTVAFWAKPNDPNQPQWTSLFSSGLPGHYVNHFQVELDGSGNFRFNYGDDHQLPIGPATTSFHHLAVSFDGTKVQVYLDGAPEGETTITDPKLGFEIVKLGINRDENRPYGGLLDEISVHTRALGPEEIARLYSAGQAGNCPRKGGK